MNYRSLEIKPLTLSSTLEEAFCFADKQLLSERSPVSKDNKEAKRAKGRVARQLKRTKAIQRAVAFANRLQHVFVATADSKGLPHVAAAGELRLTPAGQLAVAAWFCPETVINLQHNRRIAIVVWDPADDTGYQLVGEVEKVEESAFLNGYQPQVEGSSPSPQVERQLLVRVDKVIDFRHAPHSDVEE
jgi:predicted pyridoxine 5'-phosphate oxidase superfamily flavin-nucleotide-binding protein